VTIKEALKLGANAYLIKVNYTPRQIIDTVRQYIDLRKHLKISSGENKI